MTTLSSLDGKVTEQFGMCCNEIKIGSFRIKNAMSRVVISRGLTCYHCRGNKYRRNSKLMRKIVTAVINSQKNICPHETAKITNFLLLSGHLQDHGQLSVVHVSKHVKSANLGKKDD